MAVEDTLASRIAYGQALREHRERAALTQEELSQRVIVSRTHIAHIEAGRRLPNLEDAERFDRAFGTSIFVRFLPQLDGHEFPTYYQAVAQLEKQATMIREWSPTLVPGLLQTEEYTRALFRTYFPPLTDVKREDGVVRRMERGRALENPLTPVLWAMIDEAVVRRPVGGPATMARQLRHLVALGESGRVRLHLLPFGVGQHTLMDSNLTLMWFLDQPPIAWQEGLYTGSLMELPGVVRNAQTAYEQTLADALSHRATLRLLAATAEEYEE